MKRIFLLGCLAAFLSAYSFAQGSENTLKQIEFIGKKPYYDGQRLRKVKELKALVDQVNDKSTLDAFSSMKTDQTIAIVSYSGGILFSLLTINNALQYTKAVNERDWDIAHDLEQKRTGLQLKALGCYSAAIVFSLLRNKNYRKTAEAYNRSWGLSQSDSRSPVQIGFANEGLGVGLTISLR